MNDKKHRSYNYEKFKELTDEEQVIVEWQFNELGHFREALFDAMCKADGQNLARLAPGFPVEVRGYKLYSTHLDWWLEVLAKIDAL